MGKPVDIGTKDADLLDLDFDLFDNRETKETTHKIKARAMRHQAKMSALNAMKKETLAEILTRLPDDHEYIHLVSNGNYDYYTFIPVILSHITHIDELYGSTWTMNRTNCEDLFTRFDQGEIDTINIITGLYFKRRETAVYATLLEGLNKRHQRFISCENHAKVILIRSGEKYYVIEGSANWTANPRIEQNIITQSEDLYKFHQNWMNEIFKSGGE